MTHEETCHVWHWAAQVFGTRLPEVLDCLLQSYIRKPGLDRPMRLHASHISSTSSTALRLALEMRRHNRLVTLTGDYVELRSDLADFLAARLLQRMVSASQGSKSMDEHQLAADLNL